MAGRGGVILNLPEFESLTEMAKYYGLSTSTIRKYFWRYVRMYGLNNTCKLKHKIKPPRGFVYWFDEIYRELYKNGKKGIPDVLSDGRIRLGWLAKKYHVRPEKVRKIFKRWLMDTGRANYNNIYDIIGRYKLRGQIYVPREFVNYFLKEVGVRKDAESIHLP